MEEGGDGEEREGVEKVARWGRGEGGVEKECGGEWRTVGKEEGVGKGKGGRGGTEGRG